MGEQRNFQEAVRTSVLDYIDLDETNIYFEEDNGPEAVAPYVTITVPSFQRIGSASVSTHTDAGSLLTIITNYEATARLTFVGRNASGSDGGDLAFDFLDKLSNPLLLMDFRANSLSFMRNSIVRKIPKLRETRWYDAYVLDVVFAFCLETTQQIDSVETVELTGNFQSATTTKTTEFNVPD